MSERNFKLIRKQLRNIVQELLPKIEQSEIFEAVRKQVTLVMERRLDQIQEHLKTTLEAIDARSKESNERIVEMQNYVARATAGVPRPSGLVPATAPAEEAGEETPEEPADKAS